VRTGGELVAARAGGGEAHERCQLWTRGAFHSNTEGMSPSTIQTVNMRALRARWGKQ
jgi:hypothetical protein